MRKMYNSIWIVNNSNNDDYGELFKNWLLEFESPRKLGYSELTELSLVMDIPRVGNVG